MFLSIIVPTCNRNDLLKLCLQLLAPQSQTFDSDKYEVIVTDDSRSDAAKSMIETDFPWAKWVAGPKRGPAANRNNGVKSAKGEWFVFFDDDCLPSKSILSIYDQAITDHKNIQVFEGSIRADREQQSLIEESPINYNGGYLWACNFMISRKVFTEKLSGFDENFPFPSMEDVDLHYRLQKLNIECLFLPEAQVIHPWRLQKKLLSITMKRYKSTLYFLNKHPERKKDINGGFYLRAFYHSFFKQTIGKSIAYRFSGFPQKVANDILHLYLAAHLLFHNRNI